MSTNNLPPVQHLPRWPRVGLLCESCSPRRIPPLTGTPVTPAPADRAGAAGRAAQVPGPCGGEPRVASLQRNVQFLQQQHKDTLEKLHAEIEHLRRENKELQYKLIMEPPKTSRKGPTRSRRGLRPLTQGSEAHAGLNLEAPLQDLRPSHDRTLSDGGTGESSAFTWLAPGPEVTGGLITSLQPLRIHSGPSHPPRAPSLQECEAIVRQLYVTNSLQAQEILRVKALLRDIVLDKKITPENFILTKAYLVDGTCKSQEEKLLPKLGLQTVPEKVSGPSRSGVVLPALKPRLSSTVVERQRRSRAVQSNRLKRTLP